MTRLALIVLLALISTGCATNTEMQAESKPAAAESEKKRLFPETKLVTYRALPTVGMAVLNGRGWILGKSEGTKILVQGDEMALDTPNSYTNQTRALTFKILSIDTETGYMLTKVDSTEAFGEGGLNHYWGDTPYANVLVKMSDNGKSLQIKFGTPVTEAGKVDQPALPEDAPVFKLL